MSKIEIPDAAYDAAESAGDNAQWIVAVEAAAPLTVAAELRRLVRYYWPTLAIAADYDDQEHAEQEGVKSMCNVLASRAYELDPAGGAA